MIRLVELCVLHFERAGILRRNTLERPPWVRWTRKPPRLSSRTISRSDFPLTVHPNAANMAKNHGSVRCTSPPPCAENEHPKGSRHTRGQCTPSGGHAGGAGPLHALPCFTPLSNNSTFFESGDNSRSPNLDSIIHDS